MAIRVIFRHLSLVFLQDQQDIDLLGLHFPHLDLQDQCYYAHAQDWDLQIFCYGLPVNVQRARLTGEKKAFHVELLKNLDHPDSLIPALFSFEKLKLWVFSHHLHLRSVSQIFDLMQHRKVNHRTQHLSDPPLLLKEKRSLILNPILDSLVKLSEPVDYL